MRFPRITLPLACFVMFVLPAVGQSPNGNINGLVLDPSNRGVVGAGIIAVNDGHGEQFTTKSNDGAGRRDAGKYGERHCKYGRRSAICREPAHEWQELSDLDSTHPWSGGRPDQRSRCGPI